MNSTIIRITNKILTKRKRAQFSSAPFIRAARCFHGDHSDDTVNSRVNSNNASNHPLHRRKIVFFQNNESSSFNV